MAKKAKKKSKKVAKKSAKKAARKPVAAKPAAKPARKKARRTVLRSSKGTKLYAVRTAEGKFKDIQTFKRAHGQDLKRKSKAEVAPTE